MAIISLCEVTKVPSIFLSLQCKQSRVPQPPHFLLLLNCPYNIITSQRPLNTQLIRNIHFLIFATELTKIRCAVRDVTDAVQEGGGQGLSWRCMHHHLEDDAYRQRQSSSRRAALDRSSESQWHRFAGTIVAGNAENEGKQADRPALVGAGRLTDWQDEKP